MCGLVKNAKDITVENKLVKDFAKSTTEIQNWNERNIKGLIIIEVPINGKTECIEDEKRITIIGDGNKPNIVFMKPPMEF